MFKSVLFYTNKLKVVRRFYRNVLGLEISDTTDERFTVNIGESKVIFVETDQPAFYHFAINIPGNQFSIMKHWIKEKIPLNRQRAIDEVYFPSFDADAMYFEDPAGNIVELIGRRKRDLFGDLTTEAFLNISEVGVVTPFMTEIGDEIQDTGVPLFQGMEINPEEVNFLGKDDAFIVLTPPDRKWNFSEKDSVIHPLEFTLTDGNHFILDSEGNLTITSEDQAE